MKAPTLILLAAFALIACEDKSSPKADATTTTDGAGVSVMPAPAPASPPQFAEAAGMANDEAVSQSQVGSLSGRVANRPQAGDPLQNVTAGTAVPAVTF